MVVGEMEESLTGGSSGLSEAGSMGEGGAGSEESRRAEGAEADGDSTAALTAEHLRLVQMGHSGPAWLGVGLWDGIYVLGMLAGAYNGMVTVPRAQPVRACVPRNAVRANTHALTSPRSSLRASRGVGLWYGRSCNSLAVGWA